MLFSCENDINKVNIITAKDSLPIESIKNLELVYSDSGYVKIFLKSELLDSYSDFKDPYTEFPKGFEILFLDTLKNVKSKLTADYGISYDKKDIMEAKNNVVVINYETKETLNTEHLIWYKREKKIVSDVFVKITQEKRILYGNGLESDQTFNSWKILEPTGIFNYNSDDEK